MAFLLVVGVTAVIPGSNLAGPDEVDPPDWVDALEDGSSSGISPIPWEEPEPLPVPGSDPTDPLEPPDFPESRGWDIALGRPGEVGDVMSGQEGPVAVAATGSGLAGSSLHLEVMGREVAERAGASGFVFEVSDAEPGGPLSGEAAEGDLAAELSVDYSEFANAFGGDFADRLQVVALPDCALQDPVPAGCLTAGTPLPSVNNANAQELVVEVEDLKALAADDGGGGDGELGGVPVDELAAVDLSQLGVTSDGDPAPTSGRSASPAGQGTEAEGSGAVTLAVTADVSGEAGAWDATPISGTGEWQVSTGAGEFAYGYDFDVPAPPGGTAPSVSLAYSSGAVDGLTNATNTQASAVGVGWSHFGNAFIERRYEPCVKTIGSSDLCWLNQNAVISLDGVSGTLLPVNGSNTEWRLHSDPGWKVERLTGASNGDNGDGVDGTGEHWKVTASDGTQYFFGLGANPDTGAQTQSAAMVPVVGDHETDPCWGNIPGNPNAFGICDQAWRWNLDRVVDPDGNVSTYYYDRGSNKYSALNGLFNPVTYHQATMPNRIEYGSRAGSSTPAAARVVFERQYRCADLNDDCPSATASNASLFPDVPNDLICTGSSCTVTTPSFFVKTRYAAVRTEVRIDGQWQGVMQYNLAHVFGQGSSDQKKLYLRSIVQVGVTNPDDPLGLPLPPTTFNYEWLANRVDVNVAEGRKPLEHGRIDQIINPQGGTLDVAYGQNRPCAPNYNPALWHDNVRDCFPQTMYDDDRRRTGVFNKHLVTEVTESAGFLTLPMTTTYGYQGDPAWAFNYGSFAQYDQEWGWSGWRGYGTTTVAQGDSTTEVQVFRGMDGDPLWADNGGGTFCLCDEREVVVESSDGTQYEDHPALTGRTLEERSLGELDGAPGTVLQKTTYEYEHHVTHAAGSGQARDAEWAGVSSVTESVATAPGQFRRRGGSSTYDTDPALPVPRLVASLEAGWFDETGDERCSLTTYADNPGTWMFEYPASNQVVAGDCTSTEEVSVSETYYDGSTTLGAPPTRGNPTMERTKLEDGVWSETSTEFDALGRPVETTDPDGNTTTSSFEASPANALPTTSTVTNALGHTEVTEWDRLNQAPQREIDANGNVSSYHYDGLGRTAAVWLPTEVGMGFLPSWQFQYSADQRVVRSTQLTQVQEEPFQATAEDTWVIYDGLGRQWQTQQYSPATGKVLMSQTAYDERGLVLHQTEPQAVDGTPGGFIFLEEWENATRNSYDELGRQVTQEWLRGSTVARTTTTGYGTDTATVTGPDGGQVRETMDGLGRTVEVAEYDGAAWAASSYGYDLADNLVSVTDPSGNQASYTYNMAGWRLTQDDPDMGTASFSYDLVGNETRTVDSLGDQIHTSYDALSRPVERRAGSPTGDLLASWDYDATGELGLLHSTTRHTSAGDWVSEVTGYDARGRTLGTATTVPAGIPGLSGTYTTTQTYDRADRVTSTTYPAVGGLPQETVTTSYDSLGLATAMTGLEPYVRSTTYDGRGRLTAAALGPENPGGGVWMAKNWSFDADQRLVASESYVAGSGTPDGIVGRHELAYDEAGNIAERTTDLVGQAWRECFEHDARHRLTAAFTVDQAANCETGQRSTGDQPYEHRFNYHPDGRINVRTEVVDPTMADWIAYGYPAHGEDQPHAPTTVGSDTYTWDANGNLSERTVGGATETFSWDVEQNLESVTGPAGTTSFVYGAEGERLLRETSEGATAYVAGHEVTANTDGSVVTAVRSYSFEDQLVATRTPAGASYMVGDAAGSVEAAVDSGGQPSASRSYAPYGEVRAETGDMDTDRGFLGQVEDSSTNLSYLQNRYYDATTGVFLSADPIQDTGNIKSLNPYTYGSGNPTTFSDPNGLSPTYIHGLEKTNHALKGQNKQLQGHIKRLGGHIQDLQGIIKKQNRQINKLLTHIKALESVIRQQRSIIGRLVARVNYLVGVVNYQRQVIGRLQAKIAYQQRIIRWQAGVIYRQRQVIRYQAGVIRSQRTTIHRLKKENFELRGQNSYLRGVAIDWKINAGKAHATISGLQGQVSYLGGAVEELRFQRNFYYHRGHDMNNSSRISSLAGIPSAFDPTPISGLGLSALGLAGAMEPPPRPYAIPESWSFGDLTVYTRPALRTDDPANCGNPPLCTVRAGSGSW